MDPTAWLSLSLQLTEPSELTGQQEALPRNQKTEDSMFSLNPSSSGVGGAVEMDEFAVWFPSDPGSQPLTAPALSGLPTRGQEWLPGHNCLLLAFAILLSPV